MDLYEELLSVIEAFSKAKIDYALCGGIAVALHGYSRFTKDIDFLVQESDLEEIKASVKELGYVFDSGVIPFDVGTPKERRLYRLSKIRGQEVFTLDFLIVVPVYEEAWKTRELFLWEERTLQAVSKKGLLDMKMLAGRTQDKLDLEKLGLLEKEEKDEQEK